jgi:hypothetical protein
MNRQTSPLESRVGMDCVHRVVPDSLPVEHVVRKCGMSIGRFRGLKQQNFLKFLGKNNLTLSFFIELHAVFQFNK